MLLSRVRKRKLRFFLAVIALPILVKVISEFTAYTEGSEQLSYRVASERQSVDAVDTEDQHDGPAPWSVDSLLDMLGDRWQYWWIKKRIRTVWNGLEAAGFKLRGGQTCENWTAVNRRRKVMILPGVVTLTNFAKPEVIRRGGPLGELVQWADLIAACFALCHSLAVRYNIQGAVHELRYEMDESVLRRQDPTGCDSDYVDVIFTDIAAFNKMALDVRDTHRYRFRLLDVFGTEPMYNDPEYIKLHPELLPKVGWGGFGLRPKQFFTLYPHSPDNSFLGLIVPTSKSNDSSKDDDDAYSLVIGKEEHYLKNNIDALAIINTFLPLRSTINPSGKMRHLMPSGTKFYGVVDSETYQSILTHAKLCIGLGDPIESPSALEALANGCVFLNPRRRTSFSDKPTGRQVTSQVPYLEDFVGPPHVYTVDYDNSDELRRVLVNITQKGPAVGSFIPREFSVFGYLERLDAYLRHQNYCASSDKTSSGLEWPPRSALKVVLSDRGQSCKQACFMQGLVCEPDFFPIVNNASYITRMIKSSKFNRCHSFDNVSEPYVPAFLESNDVTVCQLQSRSELFSCAEGHHHHNGVRLCPCRDFIRHQLALCRDCLR